MSGEVETGRERVREEVERIAADVVVMGLGEPILLLNGECKPGMGSDRSTEIGGWTERSHCLEEREENFEIEEEAVEEEEEIEIDYPVSVVVTKE